MATKTFPIYEDFPDLLGAGDCCATAAVVIGSHHGSLASEGITRVNTTEREFPLISFIHLRLLSLILHPESRHHPLPV